MIVVLSPSFDSLLGVVDRGELVGVQAFISQPVEGFDDRVLCGLAVMCARSSHFQRVAHESPTS